MEKPHMDTFKIREREFFYKHLPYIDDDKLEAELVLFLNTLTELSDAECKRLCYYFGALRKDGREDANPLKFALKDLIKALKNNCSISEKKEFINLGDKAIKDFDNF